MLQGLLIHRAIQLGAGGAAMLLCTTVADAKDSKRVCTPPYVAYKSAQERQKAGQIHEARELLQTCIDSACGGLVPKCQALYDKLKSELPSVIPVVTDDAGNARSDVEVKVDGTVLTSKLDGMPLLVDAGMHEFSFSTASGVFATQKLMILDGQRNRFISVWMHAPGKGGQTATSADTTPIERPPPERPAPEKTAPDKSPAGTASHDAVASEEPSSPSRPRGGGFAFPKSPLPYVLAGAGLASVGAGALLIYWGRKDNDLLSQCSPSCQQSSVDHVKTMYIASDISMGVGLAALGVATWLFASSHPSEDRTPPRAAFVLGVQPSRSGAFAAVRGTF
jgi:hypothetical protein